MATGTLGRRLQLLVALLATVPLIIVGGLAYFWLLPQDRKEIIDNHLQLAHSVASQVGDHLFNAQRNLQSLASFLEPRVQQEGFFTTSILDSHVGSGDYYAAIYVVGVDGLIRDVGLAGHHKQRRSDLLGIDLSQRQIVQTVRRTGVGTWSNEMLSTVSGKLVVAYATPIGRRLLVGEIAIPSLASYVQGLPLRSRLVVAVVDSHGHVLAYSHRAFMGQLIHLDEILKAEQGIPVGAELASFELEGKSYVGTAVPVRQLGWRVLVAQPRSQAMAPIYNTARVLIIGLLSALALALVAGWLISRRLAGDFAGLAAQARAIAHGDYGQPWPGSGLREFADLEHDLRSMSQAIQQREQDLAQSQDMLLKAQSVAHVGSWEVDLATQTVRGSEEARRIYGRQTEPGEVVTFERVREIALPEDRPRMRAALEALVKNDQSYDIEFRIRREIDGEVRHVHSRAHVVRGEDGTPLKLVGTVQDITERKEAELELEASRRLLLESQAVARLGHYELNIATGTWEGSAILDQIMGIGEGYTKDVPGWLELIHPHDREEMAALLKAPGRGEDVKFDREYRIVRADDHKEHWVHGLGRVEYDEQGAPVKMIGTIQDVTQRKELEQQLIQSQKMEAIGMLAGGVAHDFNNMLSVILGYTELLSMSAEAGSPLRQKLEEIEKAALRSRDITRQLLAFSRKQMIAPKPQDLNQIINGTLKTLGRLIGENISLTFRAEEEPWVVKVDSSQVDQILMNLAVNARDSMPEGGRLLMETSNIVLDQAYCRQYPDSRPGSYVMLSMSDTGHGMDKETMARIFEPFFTTKGVGKGTGLGLATVYGTVQQNGGFINVYSEPGRGTTFKIYLPRYLGELEEASEEGPALPEGGSGHLLLVEDDDLVRQVASSLLEELGYEVDSFKQPREAIQACAQDCDRFDLLITDVVMPGMSGKELRDAVKEIHPHIGVLFMSGYTNDVIVHHGVLEEGVHFVAKPFNLPDLARKVRVAMA